MFFGVISPKIRTTSVKTPVVRPIAVAVLEAIPMFAIIRVTIVVAKDDAERLTILLPIKIALSNFWGSSIICRTRAALGLPSSSNVRIRILLTVVNAVSADEKNADNKIRIINVISCTVLAGSKIKSSPVNKN